MIEQEVKQAVRAVVGVEYYTEHELESLSIETLCLLAMEHSFLQSDCEDTAALETVRQAVIALRARAAGALAETVERKSQELWQALARSISPDFRAPLRNARGFSECVIEDPGLSGESAGYVRRAISALVSARHGGGVDLHSAGENQGATVRLWFDVNLAESPLC